MKHLGTKLLNTERLTLRRIYKEDAKEIFLGFVNQEEFIYYMNKKKRTLEEQINSLKNIDKIYAYNDCYNWVITLKDTKEIIGTISFNVFESNDCVELNYALDNRFRGNGYMTEAINKLIDFAFNELLVKRVIGQCVTKNISSKKVLERCNFTYNTKLNSAIKLCDGYHDSYLFEKINRALH